MKGSLCHEFETGLPAVDVWGVYGGLLLTQLAPQLLPQVFSKVELLEGDGGEGSVLLVTLAPAPGVAGSGYYKEVFVKIDNQNYVKELAVIEGGVLDLGFQKYSVRIEIIRNGDENSKIKSTIEYEVDDDHTDKASLISTTYLASVAEAVTKYIKEQKSSAQASKEQAPQPTSEEKASN